MGEELNVPRNGPWYSIWSRKTGRVNKSGEDTREFFLPVPVWYLNQGLASEGESFEFRPNYITGEIIYKPRRS